MSNEKIFYSSDLGDVEGYQIGLFDRIINVKFTRADGTTFTIRSDYEPVWVGDRLFFKPCQPKPDIRFQYVQYNGDMINIELFITNLNIIENSPADIRTLTTDISAVTTSQIQGDLTNLPNDALTSKGNKQIKHAEIEMGYRGQFPDWSKYDGSVSPEVAYAAFQNLEQIQNLDLIDQNNRLAVSELANTQMLFQQYRKCSISIEQAYTINNPPDKITQFHGYIGTADIGLAPFAFQTMGDPSDVTAGTEVLLTKDDIRNELDDKHKPIDMVFSDVDDSLSNFDPKIEGVYRNLFNGGRGFTLLEGFCFHMLTRRFIRPNIPVKRNKTLEQAALAYTQIAKNDVAVKEEIEQSVLTSEQTFVGEKVIITKKDKKGKKKRVVADTAPATIKESVEKVVQLKMAEQSIGPRFTIKNLPEYRKLYLQIRNRLAEAAAKKEYMSWWAAASSLKGKLEIGPGVQKAYSETIEDASKYTLDLQDGVLNDTDCYFNGLLGKDWIIPVQNMVNSATAKNHQGMSIKIKTATKVEGSNFGSSGELQPLKCFTGLLEVRDAYLFGIPILCSEKASSIFNESHANKETVQTQFFPDAKHQIDWICKTWNLRCYKLHNGGYYIYAPSENARAVAAQTFITEQSRKPFRIPAIYDMTLSPVRKIRMPFMGFIDPFTKVEWNSSSMIGEMVSFYYQPEKGRNFFLVIKNSIDFSTVDDFNMMEMDVIDDQYTEPPAAPPAITGSEKTAVEKNYYREVIIIPDGGMNTWKKIHDSYVTTIPVSKLPLWPGEEVTKDHRLTEDKRVSNFQFFKQMYNWNATLFTQALVKETGAEWDDIKQRIDSEADSLYGKTRPVVEVDGVQTTDEAHFPNITYCMEKLTDSSLKRIYMKIPIMPADNYYDDMSNIDDQTVLVYQNGSWYDYLKTDLPEYKVEAK